MLLSTTPPPDRQHVHALLELVRSSGVLTHTPRQHVWIVAHHSDHIARVVEREYGISTVQVTPQQLVETGGDEQQEAADLILSDLGCALFEQAGIQFEALRRALRPGGELCVAGPTGLNTKIAWHRARARLGLFGLHEQPLAAVHDLEDVETLIRVRGMEVMRLEGMGVPVGIPEGLGSWLPKAPWRAGATQRGCPWAWMHPGVRLHARLAPEVRTGPALNFMMVGAPKCGTTTVSGVLSRHPEVFLAPEADAGLFCPNLWMHMSDYGNLSQRYGGYLRAFEGSSGHRAIGERTVWTMYDPDGARLLSTSMPSIRVLILLRNPVDFLASLHGQVRTSGDEPVSDLETALTLVLEQRRRRFGSLKPRFALG
ncbi:MAG: hypothetical protein AAFX99_11925, partial [Myxococcota bacterium]